MRLSNRPTTGQQGSNAWSATCTAAELVGDAVYVSAAGQVRQATADDLARSRVAGFILAKDGDLAATVVSDGRLSVFSGLTPGTTYYLAGTPGAIALVPGGQATVEVGEALSATELVLRLGEMTDM